MSQNALEILNSLYGYDSFRGHQAEIIEHVSAGNNALVLMPTGGGKSLCYQIPSLIRDGVGVIISPLIALMQDQVDAMQQLGVKAAFLNSSLSHSEQNLIEQQLMAGQLDLLYIAPERLIQSYTLDLLERCKLALFAIGAIMNEAHLNKVLGYIELGKEQGAEPVLTGKQVLQDSGGFYLSPTIFDQVDPNARIAQEEIFGPVLSVIGFKDDAEAIAIANNSTFGLAAYVATQNLGRVRRLGDELRSAITQVIATDKPSGGNLSISFEAPKQSGVGFEGGVRGLEAYTVASAVICFT